MGAQGKPGAASPIDIKRAVDDINALLPQLETRMASDVTVHTAAKQALLVTDLSVLVGVATRIRLRLRH